MYLLVWPVMQRRSAVGTWCLRAPASLTRDLMFASLIVVVVCSVFCCVLGVCFVCLFCVRVCDAVEADRSSFARRISSWGVSLRGHDRPERVVDALRSQSWSGMASFGPTSELEAEARSTEV